MARVTYVEKARPSKNARRCTKCSKAINVGDTYKWFATRIGRSSNRKNFCADCSIRPSDKTTSGNLQTLYGATEAAEDALAALAEDFTLDDVAALLIDAVEGVREAAQMYTESAQNMEDGFGHETYQSEEIKGKAEELETFATELEDAASEVENLDDPNEEDEELLKEYDGDVDDEEEKEEYLSGIRDERREAATEKANDALGNCPL